ncbi:hypothetical protein Acj9p057 [Acinetobacter phage Acj9]|uniref:Uncharacterized protein n=1 Tax=Acinetobacter phage Acj9 TaxID=760939 RepID=E5EPJ1_9CAUD|nr:hypothetical protein Acj9p057 [Acinetobacter phage Acj9]ADG59957.1 hypothetical protein Acj9p057 [Acinetobacter phage Acj9]
MTQVIFMYDDGQVSFDAEVLKIVDVQLHINDEGETYTANRFEVAVPLAYCDESYLGDDTLLERVVDTHSLSLIVVITPNNNYSFEGMYCQSVTVNQPKTYVHLVFRS